MSNFDCPVAVNFQRGNTSRGIKRVVEFLVFVLIIQSSRAIVRLLMDGGAVDHDTHSVMQHDETILGYVMVCWKLAVLLIFAFLLFKRRLRKLYFDPLLSTIILLCFMSMLWAEYPREVRTNSLMILFSYLLVILHFKICGWQSVMRFLKNVFLLISILSIAFVALLPSYGISVGEHEGHWQGVFGHKNELGLFATMAYSYFLGWHEFDKSVSTKAGIFLTFILIIGCGSTTALFCLLLVSTIYVLRHIRLTKKIIFAQRYLLLTMLGVAFLLAMYFSIAGNVIEIGSKNTSFTNRNVVWAYYLLQVYDQPWLGHGLEQIPAAIRDDSSDFLQKIGFVIGSADNGFIELLHAFGIVGLGLVIALMIKQLRLKNDPKEFDMIFMLLMVFIVENVFASFLLGFNLYLIMLMYISSFLIFSQRGQSTMSEYQQHWR